MFTFRLAALLYGGPDQLMPITSGFAALFAFLLIFWNKVLVFVGKLLNLFTRNKAVVESAPGFEQPSAPETVTQPEE